MKRFPTSVLCAFLFCFAVTSASAQSDLSLHSVFSEHMVLQRDASVPIWGAGKPGTKVAVAFADQKVEATVGDNGTWRAELKALSANAKPQTLTVTSGDKKLEVEDVLVGDVWVGSGQSNMAGNVASYAKRDPTLAALLEKAPYPEIRLMKCGGPKPNWTEATPETIPGFSAILFAFGERLHRDLDVPIGLIVGAVGGTPSGSWIPAETYANSEKCKAAVAEFAKTWDRDKAMNQYEAKLVAWQAAVEKAKAEGKKPRGRKPQQPVNPGECSRGEIGNLYARFIDPVAGYRIKGVLWDQGEARSAVLGVDQFTMMSELIRGWREEWEQGDFPFIFVQKPSGGGCAFSKENPITREASEFTSKLPDERQIGPDSIDRYLYVRLMLDNPNAWMVPAADLGGSIHPINKWGYGNRAAEVALSKVYKSGVQAFGPIYESHRVDGDNVIVEFNHIGKGLTTAHSDQLSGFALAGEDGKWHWADARIDGNRVVVTCKEVQQPKKVSYALSSGNVGFANLFNKDGLRALSFVAGGNSAAQRE